MPRRDGRRSRKDEQEEERVPPPLQQAKAQIPATAYCTVLRGGLESLWTNARYRRYGIAAIQARKEFKARRA
ncbi:hypothetical protein QOT17_004328 [Balamuthia mandrillaris]